MTAPTAALHLTEAEHAVVALLAQGHTINEAVGLLNATRGSVKARLADAIRHNGGRDRAALVANCCRAGHLGGLPATGLRPAGLPPRLAEVLALIAAGLPEAEAARSLFLSLEGLRSRRQALFVLLGARSRAHAVLIAYQAGLLPEATR